MNQCCLVIIFIIFIILVFLLTSPRNTLGGRRIVEITGGYKYKPIFVGGYAASGKSTVVNKFTEKGYCLIALDEVIREEILPKFVDKDHASGTFFTAIYADKFHDKVYDKARCYFVQIVKKIIRKHKGKVVAEGLLRDHKLIREIFGSNNQFEFYLVQPKSLEVWTQRLICRWDKEPEDYGRISFLKKQDDEMNNEGMKDYLKNGIKGKIFKNVVKKVAKERYPKHQELYDEYATEFDINIIKNG